MTQSQTDQTDKKTLTKLACHHCEGKGYIEIRDCSGEIQRSENCSFCEGTGQSSAINNSI